MKTAFLLFLLFAGCASNPLEGPGCHYVSGGHFVGYTGLRYLVVVDGRSIADFSTGQEAMEFIRQNNLHTCELTNAAP